MSSRIKIRRKIDKRVHTSEYEQLSWMSGSAAATKCADAKKWLDSMSDRTKLICLAVLVLMSIGGITSGVIFLVQTASTCDTSEYMKWDVTRNLIPTAAGYSYTLNSDETELSFTRDSLTRFTIGPTATYPEVVFSKSSSMAYFWPSWTFTHQNLTGVMAYNLFHIINKYSVSWPHPASQTQTQTLSTPPISWDTERVVFSAIPSTISIYKNPPSSEKIASFNSQLSLTKSYNVCVKDTANPFETVLALATSVSHAIHIDA